MKNIVKIFCFLMLLAVVLCSCGDNGTETNDTVGITESTSETAAVTEDITVSEKKITLVRSENSSDIEKAVSEIVSDTASFSFSCKSVR